jgi:phosphohistidine phosphatase
MKNLLLMRHAKSSFEDNQASDFERGLNKRGEKDAPRMGKLLKDKDLVPDIILSSKSVRTAKTAELVAEKAGYKKEISYIEGFYLGEPDVYLEALSALEDDGNDTVLVVGHNPGLETLLQVMTDHVESLPTGAVAYLELPIRSWKALKRFVVADLKKLWRPRDL